MERRRAAILAADVVGYSRLTERDEEASTAMLRVYRAVVEELISAHKGHIFTFFCRNCGRSITPFWSKRLGIGASSSAILTSGGSKHCVRQIGYRQYWSAST